MRQGKFHNKIKQVEYELVEEDTSNGLQNNKQKIESDNNSNQPNHSTRISSTLTTSKKNSTNFKNKDSPLKFAIKIRDNYLISFKKNQWVGTIIKFFIWLIIDIGLTYFLEAFPLSAILRIALIVLLYGSCLLYLVLFFLDPGTLTDDQQQNFDQDRIYCMTCELYRNYKSKHCIYCNRCVKGYDHHCSVFGKCIGKRNLLVFYLFITMTCLTFVLFFVSIVYQLFQVKDQNKTNLPSN